MRRRARVDGNHAEIVKALRAIGASVQDLSRVGEGCPDLIAGYHGRNLFLECKDGSKPASATKLTADQQIWLAKWAGAAVVVFTPEQAQEMVISICMEKDRR